MELKKKNDFFFTKALLKLRTQGFSEEDVNACANITAVSDKIVMWNKLLHTYREFYIMYIEFSTWKSDTLGKEGGGVIGFQVCVTDGVANVV